MGGGPPDFPPDSSCPVVLWIPAISQPFHVRGFYPLRPGFPTVFHYARFDFCRSLTPKFRRSSVWALSRSLAATWKIVFTSFSSGYLDVSVHRVPYITLLIHVMLTELYLRRVSPFGHPWIVICLRFPTAFRSLPRPSSALGAKAFTLCSYLLDLLI